MKGKACKYLICFVMQPLQNRYLAASKDVYV
jgi:hypothetical protein